MIDEAVARRIIQATGHDFGTCYGKHGIGYVKEKVKLFNRSAARGVMLVMVDFIDTGADCPPEVVSQYLPHRNSNMIFRVVVAEIESWLLADRTNLANFLCVPQLRMPTLPEQVSDPKQAVVNLARTSRCRHIREAIVPPPQATITEGKMYATEIMKFVREHWDMQKARHNAPSLNKCLSRLEMLR
ncbi:MAG: hypothetical protein M0Z79_13455 [Nitrospiraceae bacterium]|nr:hypothetical protein [Nitrospiraceae bacterium]